MGKEAIVLRLLQNVVASGLLHIKLQQKEISEQIAFLVKQNNERGGIVIQLLCNKEGHATWIGHINCSIPSTNFNPGQFAHPLF